MLFLLSTYGCFTAPDDLLRDNLPLALVVAVSVVVGLLMVLVFRYTSDQKAIHVVKDQLKAHLLAVRLFQDQLPVVLSSYGRILTGTGRYLRLALRPLLFVILPLIVLIVQLDGYLSFVPLEVGKAFLVTVRTSDSDSLDALTLELPPNLTATAPPVHVSATDEVVWRVVAQKSGNYDVNVGGLGGLFSKQAVVSSTVSRVSSVRLRGRFWERMFLSNEPALPENSPMQAIEVSYPARIIHFVWLDWNWIWLFFVLSLVAGFFFKTVLRIEI